MKGMQARDEEEVMCVNGMEGERAGPMGEGTRNATHQLSVLTPDHRNTSCNCTLQHSTNPHKDWGAGVQCWESYGKNEIVDPYLHF